MYRSAIAIPKAKQKAHLSIRCKLKRGMQHAMHGENEILNYKVILSFSYFVHTKKACSNSLLRFAVRSGFG